MTRIHSLCFLHDCDYLGTSLTVCRDMASMETPHLFVYPEFHGMPNRVSTLISKEEAPETCQCHVAQPSWLRVHRASPPGANGCCLIRHCGQILVFCPRFLSQARLEREDFFLQRRVAHGKDYHCQQPGVAAATNGDR